MSLGAASSPNSWRNPKLVFLLMLVFGCGGLAGAVAARSHYRGIALRATAAAQQKAWKEGGKDISVERFRKELSLTEEQTREVAEVLDDFMKYYQTLQAQMDDVRANGKERIVHLLNAEQREKFSRMMSELQARQQIR
ncbi:MAG: hypothetical protein FJW31_25200 [Acidobacteria bacterium]|nr:hypothetical protein [Acidobacteriota bacterium]